MALLEIVLSWWTPFIVAVGILCVYLHSYFFTFRGLKKIPAPFPAQFTNLWLLLAARSGSRYRIVDEVHKRLGPVVRLQPNHVSVADDSAIQAILGHGNGFLKS
jgi:benzoate 4-monooxygenase